MLTFSGANASCGSRDRITSSLPVALSRAASASSVFFFSSASRAFSVSSMAATASLIICLRFSLILSCASTITSGCTDWIFLDGSSGFLSLANTAGLTPSRAIVKTILMIDSSHFFSSSYSPYPLISQSEHLKNTEISTLRIVNL
jgi:hypothetical protein